MTLYREDPHHQAATDFSYDAILPPTATQADVYDVAAKPAVKDVLQGYNATLLAYGQTGAGKTFTLSSIQPNAVGVIPRALQEVFDSISQDSVHAYTVTLSYLQIYCEQIQDLLCPDSGDNLPIRESPSGPYVPELKQIEVTSLEECLQLLQLGARNRNVAFTELNAHSSRSHAVVVITVVKRPNSPSFHSSTAIASTSSNNNNAVEKKKKQKKTTTVQVGKLYMVDLAGSERLKKSKSTGQRASEAKAINLSLTTLGMCVSARASGTATHIPFRDSKLTRLLQESLGGNARTAMIINVCDALEYAEETLQSLQFGSRAMRVVTQAVVNEHDVEMSMAGGGGGAGGDGGNEDGVDVMMAVRGGPASPLQTSRAATLMHSLLEKESELEAVQLQLQAHQEQSRQVVQALKREHEEMASKAARAREEQRAQEEAMHRAMVMAEQRVVEVESKWVEEREAMREEMVSLKADALRSAKEAEAAHTLLEEGRQRWAEQEERMREEREMFKTNAELAMERARREEGEVWGARWQALEEEWNQKWEEWKDKLEKDAEEWKEKEGEYVQKLKEQELEWKKKCEGVEEAWRQQEEEAQAEYVAEAEKKEEEWQRKWDELSTSHAREREEWKEEKAAMVQRYEDKMVTLTQTYEGKNLSSSAEIKGLKDELEACVNAIASERQSVSDKVAEVERVWVKKRKTVIERAEARMQELKAIIAAKEDDIVRIKDTLASSEEMNAHNQGRIAKLEQRISEQDATFTDMLARVETLNNNLLQTQKENKQLTFRAEAAERAREKLAQTLKRDRTLNHAATVIQRAFRAYRFKILQKQNSEGYSALSEAQKALGSLAQQHADLEARRHSNLALTGQTLVAESLGTMQELVERLVSEFLLPARDQKALQRLRAKAPATTSTGGGGGGGGIGAVMGMRATQGPLHHGNGLIGAVRAMPMPTPTSTGAPPSDRRLLAYTTPQNA